MREIQITLTTRFLERIVFSAIIILLIIILIGKYTSESVCEEVKEDTTTTETTTVVEEESTETVTEEETPPPESTPPPPVEEEELSGDLKVELGKIDFEILESGAARINNIKISITNGLDDDVLLFVTIDLREVGNPDLEIANPYWNKVKMPLVKSGETKLVTIEPTKKFPVDLTNGDTLVVNAEFTDFTESITISDDSTVKV